MTATFSAWIDAHLEKLGTDVHQVFTIESVDGLVSYHIPLTSVIAEAKEASPAEQQVIKSTLTELSRYGLDETGYLLHLAVCSVSGARRSLD